MTETKKQRYCKIGAALQELGLLLQEESVEDAPQMPDKAQFEAEYHKRTIAKLANDLGRRKRVPLVLVADWTGKSIDWFQTKDGLKALPLRNDEKNNRHCADVIKFLCEEWEMPLPEGCEVHLAKSNRQTAA